MAARDRRRARRAGALAALRGRRLLGAALGALGAAGIADEFPPKRRRLRRSLLPTRTAYNVVCELGDPEAERTVVVTAHHDAAHSGIVFHPALPEIADRLGMIEKIDTSPALMAPVVGGPLLAALGALTRRPHPRQGSGSVLGAGTGRGDGRDRAARASSPAPTTTAPRSSPCSSWPAASAPSRRAGSAILLVSMGAEESFSEGIKAFGERHFAELPRESTFFLCLESIGSPHLLVLRGEGFLKMREYPPRSLAFIDALAEELGIWLFPNLRLHNGTDGLEPLAAGYEAVALCSLHRPQAGRQLPLVQRPRRERRLRHRGRRGAAQRDRRSAASASAGCRCVTNLTNPDCAVGVRAL